MKKTLLLLMTLLLALSLWACGEDAEPAQNDASSPVAPEGTAMEEVSYSEFFSVALQEPVIIQDAAGNDIVLVYYQFVNNSSEPLIAQDYVMAQVSQGGKLLEFAAVSQEDVPGGTDLLAIENGVRPGQLAECVEAFLLDGSDTLEVELVDAFGQSSAPFAEVSFSVNK